MQKHVVKPLVGVEAMLSQATLRPMAKRFITPVSRGLDRVLGFKKLNCLLNNYDSSVSFADFCTELKKNIAYRVDDKAQMAQNLPKTGACVVVCNHPTGFSEITAIPGLILAQRSDLKILGNKMLSGLPFAGDNLIAIDVYDSNSKKQQIKQCQDWLDQGGVLLIFPAGEISDYNNDLQQARDIPWSHLPLRLAQKTNAPIVHVHVNGKNSARFYATSRVFRDLRAMWFSKELYNKKDYLFKVDVSKPVMLGKLDSENTKELVQYFYELNYSLPYRHYFDEPCKGYELAEKQQRLPIELPCMEQACLDLKHLNQAHVLCEFKTFKVYDAASDELPRILPLIQKARERTFRQVGMGTGEDTDSDCYDEKARHLFIWDHAKNSLVGAYRYLIIDSNNHTSYISALYDIDYPQMSQCGALMEGSRSFILSEYQRTYGGLMCLWRGLAQVVLKHPNIRFLTGLVSIAKQDISPVYADLVSAYVTHKISASGDFPGLFSPHHPYIPAKTLPHQLLRCINTVESFSQLENMLFQLSSNEYKLPILFKQYESIGMLPINMSVDPSFSDCIDVLQLWDIKDRVPNKLKLFFGREGFKELQQRFS